MVNPSHNAVRRWFSGTPVTIWGSSPWGSVPFPKWNIWFSKPESTGLTDSEQEIKNNPKNSVSMGLFTELL